MTTLPLRSFRLVCKPEQIPLVEALLQAQGYAFEPEPFHPLARRLVHEPTPLGASLAAVFGYVYIQDRSSMLPPLALAPAPGAAVLDMCASPGSKTGFLGQMVGDAGFVLGNEPAKHRLATLRRNLQNLNLFCCATTSHPGESLPLPGAGPHRQDFTGEDNRTASPGWDFIQLDPPCSGWGTVEKNPRVMDLWQGDKVKPLIVLQRRLLREAERLLRPGGRLVYSTCTTNVEENEHQLAYACDELGFVFSPLAPPPGFDFADPRNPRFAGSLQVSTGRDGQGFFVACLHKPGPDCLPEQPGSHEADPEPRPEAGGRTTGGLAQGAGGGPDSGPNGGTDGLEQAPAVHEEAAVYSSPGFFVRPWEKESRFVGERRRHGKNARGERGPASFALLPREALFGIEHGLCVDATALPPGDIAVFNGVAHFLPRQSGMLLPRGFAWKGFVLGKAVDGNARGTHRGAGVRVHQSLHGLMPSLESAQAHGLPHMVVNSPARLLPLLAGRSLGMDPATADFGPDAKKAGPEATELGLYFRGLPLCRLSVKGKRVILPPL